MQGFLEKASALVDGYGAQFAAKGINITLSKKYFEEEVGERWTYHRDAGVRLLGHIDRWLDKKREKKKGYRNQPNRYHVLIVKLLPADKGVLPKELCREYAFTVKRKSRYHVGEAPRGEAVRRRKAACKNRKAVEKAAVKGRKRNG